jgi:hypothetical protein
MKQAIVTVSCAAAMVCLVQACQPHYQIDSVHKVEVAPMHITIDVNVKVDRALDDFFSDLDSVADDIKPPKK